MNADGTGNGLPWMDPPTETPTAGVPEIWEIHNWTEDAHPIHLHQTQFQVLDRSAPGLGTKAAQPYENGPKDVVVSLPNPDPEGHPGAAVTRVLATFDIKGRFVWHCHILEHEDNEMMRPLQVT